MAEFVDRHKRTLIIASVVFAVSLTVLYFLVPAVAAAFAILGGWAVVVTGIVLANWETVEKHFGRGLSVLSWAGSAIHRQALASELQGVINGGRKELGDELGDLMPYPASVRFVKEETDLAQLADGEIVIALRHPKNHSENTARATLAYVSTGMARPARPYVDAKTMQSVDYSVAKKLLAAVDRDALDFLLSRMWLPAVERDGDLQDLGHMVETIEEEGWLTRILLAEYLEVGRRLFGRFPPADVQIASRRFLEFLYEIASRDEAERVNLDFRDGEFRIALVLVGDPEVRARVGAAAYVQRALMCQDRGFDSVYLLARGQARPVVEEAVRQIELGGRVLDVVMSETRVRAARGRTVDAVFARVVFDQTGASIGRSRAPRTV